jgi:SIR2-like domain
VPIEIPYPLLSDIFEGRCLPFVGAGFSKNADLPPGLVMPDWNELSASLSRHLHSVREETPQEVAQRYETHFGRVQLIEAIRRALHTDSARPGRAHRAFAKLPFDTIYTTNFDLLLEDAYQHEKRPFRSLVGEHQLPFHAGRTASSVVKMHGDLRHEENIVVTKRDYDEFMTKYPVVATHLSAMLITRTPLYIGYSLSDQDFLHIQDVVRSRLGQFERMSYVLAFDPSDLARQEALGRHVHLVSLPSEHKTSSIAELLESIQEHLDAMAGTSLRASRPDVFERIEPEIMQQAVALGSNAGILDTTSRLCFVLMPFGAKFDAVYRTLIAPSVEDAGLSVMRADEMTTPGFILEQIRSAIQQARLIVADVTGANPNVLYELGFAQASGKPVVMIAESADSAPFDIASQRIFVYGTSPSESRNELESAIRTVLSEERLAEARALFKAKHYRGAIAAAAVVLENELRGLFVDRPVRGIERMGLGQMLREVARRRLVSSPLHSKLRQVVEIRNHAVHHLDEPDRAAATVVIEVARDFLKSVRKKAG